MNDKCVPIKKSKMASDKKSESPVGNSSGKMHCSTATTIDKEKNIIL